MPPERRIWWGDLHSHTDVSGDGIGTGEDAHEYARHVAGLDFYSRTDHNSYFEDGTLPGDFTEYVRISDESDAPGEFVALNGYEVSFGSPYGHHNVYFRDRPVQVGDPSSTTLPEIWKALEGRRALTIPHHTLKMPAVVDWTGDENEAQRRNFEIYSAHGLSEEFDPYHPLAIEQSLFTNASASQRTGMWAQRAWENGLRLSTIAASDDHRAQPGLPHHGLAAGPEPGPDAGRDLRRALRPADVRHDRRPDHPRVLGRRARDGRAGPGATAAGHPDDGRRDRCDRGG